MSRQQCIRFEHILSCKHENIKVEKAEEYEWYWRKRDKYWTKRKTEWNHITSDYFGIQVVKAKLIMRSPDVIASTS